jgi:hypothetical protein
MARGANVQQCTLDNETHQIRMQGPTKTEHHKRELGLSSKGEGNNKIVLVVGVDGL